MHSTDELVVLNNENGEYERSPIYGAIEQVLARVRDTENLGRSVASGGERRSIRGGGSTVVRRDGISLSADANGDRAGREELREVIASAFRRCNPRHRIVHAIYGRAVPFEESDVSLMRDIQRSFNGSIFIVGYHNEHYHVVHDCNWSCSTCRCARIKGLQLGGGQQRPRTRYNWKVTPTSDWSVEHWINLLQYLDSAGRRLGAIEISGKLWLRHCGGEFSSSFEGSAFRLERGMESIRVSLEDSGSQCIGSSLYPGYEIDIGCNRTSDEERRWETHGISEESNGRDGRRGGSLSRRPEQRKEKTESLLIYLKSIIFTPPKALFQSRIWLKGPFRFVDRRKNFFQIVYEQLKVFYTELTVEDLWLHLLTVDPLHLFFASEDTHNYYYSIKKSVKLLECLLNYQYNNDEERVQNFLQDLYDILNKLRPKCNTLFVLGEPNSGKNWFFDATIHFCVNFGIITNWNRHNQFPLQDCTNRRVLFWNEPNFEDGVIETLKMLFGGDQCGARIKYEGDAVISRTPIIILSNNDCFPKDLAFRSRMIRHQWHSCKELKRFGRKPHPMAIPYLFARWKIIDTHNITYDFTTDDMCIINDDVL